MSTDREWERWAVQDPYYSVLTNPIYRSNALTTESRQEFFDSGRTQVTDLLELCRRQVDAGFSPRRVLDFGCGVGRLVIPFAELAAEVVGVDVAPSMLAEARRNCSARGLSNVELLPSDDRLSAVDGQFDLVHSFIVLQHLELSRGRDLFAALVDRIQPAGLGALHVTYGWDHYAATLGQRPPPPPPASPPGRQARLRTWLGSWRADASEPAKASAPASDPEMQMNFYNLSELMYIVKRAGVERVHTELSDHGGVYGAYLLFQKPA